MQYKIELYKADGTLYHTYTLEKPTEANVVIIPSDKFRTFCFYNQASGMGVHVRRYKEEVSLVL